MIKMKDLFSKPNQISFIRILLIPVFVMFLLMEVPYKNYIAAFIFIILSLSDALDGYIARKKKQVTGIGKIIDPISDKLLISAALIFLVGRIQLWMAVVIIVREVVITLVRLFLLPKKVVIPASILGKLKTITQIVAIIAVILETPMAWWLMLLAVIVTVISGADYVVKIRKSAGENIFSLPNIVTTFRLALIPFFISNVVSSNINIALIIAAVFILSDKLDGIFARMTEQITTFGKMYDAFTDYMLVVSAYVAFYISGILNAGWIAVFALPTISLSMTRALAYYRNSKGAEPFGKVLIGVSYTAGIALLIDFPYKLHILVIVALMGYAYAAFDIRKSLKAF